MKYFPTLHALHNETLKPMSVPFDDSLWPESWKTVEFKEYPRFPSIVLPTPASLPGTLATILERRSSTRVFDPNTTLDVQSLSTLLHWSGGISKNREVPEHSTRHYPSGGARFPLELYLSFKGNDAVPQGLYHYNVMRHSLESLLGAEADTQIRNIPNYPWVIDAPLILLVSALFERNTRKYKERGYRFVNIEVGGLLQTIYLVAEALGMKCCALGTIVEPDIEKLLDLDLSNERMLLHVALGK